MKLQDKIHIPSDSESKCRGWQAEKKNYSLE